MGIYKQAQTKRAFGLGMPYNIDPVHPSPELPMTPIAPAAAEPEAPRDTSMYDAYRQYGMPMAVRPEKAELIAGKQQMRDRLGGGYPVVRIKDVLPAFGPYAKMLGDIRRRSIKPNTEELPEEKRNFTYGTYKPLSNTSYEYTPPGADQPTVVDVNRHRSPAVTGNETTYKDVYNNYVNDPNGWERRKQYLDGISQDDWDKVMKPRPGQPRVPGNGAHITPNSIPVSPYSSDKLIAVTDVGVNNKLGPHYMGTSPFAPGAGNAHIYLGKDSPAMTGRTEYLPLSDFIAAGGYSGVAKQIMSGKPILRDGGIGQHDFTSGMYPLPLSEYYYGIPKHEWNHAQYAARPDAVGDLEDSTPTRPMEPMQQAPTDVAAAAAPGVDVLYRLDPGKAYSDAVNGDTYALNDVEMEQGIASLNQGYTRLLNDMRNNPDKYTEEERSAAQQWQDLGDRQNFIDRNNWLIDNPAMAQRLLDEEAIRGVGHIDVMRRAVQNNLIPQYIRDWLRRRLEQVNDRYFLTDNTRYIPRI